MNYKDYLSNQRIALGETFTPTKTTDVFKHVVFSYSDEDIWVGVIPISLSYSSFEINEDDDEAFGEYLVSCYDSLTAESRTKFQNEIEQAQEFSADNETNRVLKALLSFNWECRPCAVGKINDQPAARIRSLKQKGIIIATISTFCPMCNENKTSDIIVPLKLDNVSATKQRAVISKKLQKRILDTLDGKCAVTEKKQASLIIDHKFPSQRWEFDESANPDDMSSDAIEHKFQLLTNQYNMQKSRECDSCVKNNVRGTFFGIEWYYTGDRNYIKDENDIEKSCIGCPWYDVIEWKNQVFKRLIHK